MILLPLIDGPSDSTINWQTLGPSVSLAIEMLETRVLISSELSSSIYLSSHPEFERRPFCMRGFCVTKTLAGIFTIPWFCLFANWKNRIQTCCSGICKIVSPPHGISSVYASRARWDRVFDKIDCVAHRNKTGKLQLMLRPGSISKSRPPK